MLGDTLVRFFNTEQHRMFQLMGEGWDYFQGEFSHWGSDCHCFEGVWNQITGHLSRACLYRPGAPSQPPAALILGLGDQSMIVFRKDSHLYMQQLS